MSELNKNRCNIIGVFFTFGSARLALSTFHAKLSLPEVYNCLKNVHIRAVGLELFGVLEYWMLEQWRQAVALNLNHCSLEWTDI